MAAKTMGRAVAAYLMRLVSFQSEQIWRFWVGSADNSDPVAKALVGYLVKWFTICSCEEACEHNERDRGKY